jgi:hypothetical protein
MAQNGEQVESDCHRRTLYSPYVKTNERVCEFVLCDVLCVRITECRKERCAKKCCSPVDAGSRAVSSLFRTKSTVTVVLYSFSS